MKVIKITLEEKIEITDKTYIECCFFNPFINEQYDWVLAKDEVNEITNPDYLYFKNYPTIDFNGITEYRFINFYDYDTANSVLSDIKNCFSECSQNTPHKIFEKQGMELIPMGYCILVNDSIYNCLSEIQKEQVLVSAYQEIYIDIK
jgi:hypothetical protein